MAHRVQLIPAFALLLGACGISVVGVDPIAGEGGAPLGPDGSTGTPADSAPPPGSFQVVGYGDGASPTGFDALDVVENPIAEPGSCDCGPCTATGATCDAPTFKTVRGTDDFQRILRNVAAFTDMQRREGLARPRVSLWLTGLKETIAQLPDFVRIAHQVGVAEDPESAVQNVLSDEASALIARRQQPPAAT